MIVGAGLSGLLAAHVFQAHPILEASQGPLQMHRALLRFRTDAVSALTGIEFRRVRVHKGIFADGKFVAPNIRLANAYAQKCLGRTIGDRSIWNLESVDRFIAPETFYEQLVQALGNRIHWGINFDFSARHDHAVINTAPLPVVLAARGMSCDQKFERAPISVWRFRLSGWDVHQTVYFPTPRHNLYRASITGDLLLCEFAGEPEGGFWEEDVQKAFCLDRTPDEIDKVRQNYGKIAPINDAARKSILHELTVGANIYSVGRFATWRNILLDDVVKDLAVIKKLMNANSYERSRRLLGGE